MAKRRNFTVNEETKEIVIYNYSELTENETREIKNRTELGGYTIGDRPKRKASPLSKLKKDQILEVVKGNSEAEKFYKDNSDKPFMTIKKLMKDKYPDLFTSEAIIKAIPSIKRK